MNRASRVVEFYTLTNILKNTIRKGWLDSAVSAKRIESVAEHIYGVQMLALAMYHEYEYDLDIQKIIYMIAIHELEETIIGDLTFRDINELEKKKIGHEAVEKILNKLLNSDCIKKLIYEFDERKSEEAVFAYYCDKLECDLQCKLYDEGNYVNFADIIEVKKYDPENIEKIINGEITWSNWWMNNDRNKFLNDCNFLEVLDYAISHDISNEN